MLSSMKRLSIAVDANLHQSNNNFLNCVSAFVYFDPRKSLFEVGSQTLFKDCPQTQNKKHYTLILTVITDPTMTPDP